MYPSDPAVLKASDFQELKSEVQGNETGNRL